MIRPHGDAYINATVGSVPGKSLSQAVKTGSDFYRGPDSWGALFNGRGCGAYLRRRRGRRWTGRLRRPPGPIRARRQRLRRSLAQAFSWAFYGALAYGCTFYRRVNHDRLVGNELPECR